jgi:hypothetical protein
MECIYALEINDPKITKKILQQFSNSINEYCYLLNIL